MGARAELHGEDPEARHTQPDLFSLYEEEPGGSRPDRIAVLSAPQERDLRRTVEDLGSVCPFVQILDLLVPQTVDNVTDALRISPIAGTDVLT